ncbi:hypothetical protein EST38_g4064 [Candolleomyces aberdarensis]|uniref:Uncharacterized protein n=1 Tax=Candolleomyces aberdarensis TaxID=2316362 RepID=A0A4Q2DRG6_9AGAR|nr:hypothetical protein EST38_g4064 [Candolleomyces aberdarensis]
MNFHESWQGRNAPDHPSNFNRTDGDAPDIPANIHGTKAFLVKFQVGVGDGRPSHMFMYDRQRSFKIFWKRSGDPDAFAVAERAIGGNLKMYRWCKRLDDRNMSVCFDKEPEETPPCA